MIQSRAALLTLTSSSSETFLGPVHQWTLKQTSLALVFVTGQAFFRSINGFTPSAKSTVFYGIPIFRISKL